MLLVRLCSVMTVVMGLAIPVPGWASGMEAGGARKALSQYKLDALQTEQGLLMDQVQGLIQTSDGYLCVGTLGGFARFDGSRFTTFDAPEVSQSVFGLKEDAGQTLWIK